MNTSDLIVVVCPGKSEDLTQYIGSRVAEEAGVLYTADESLPTTDYILVLEIGGIWDRDENDMAVEDKTKSKIFESVLGFYFKTTKMESMRGTFKTSLSKMFNSNYARIELTNKVRYCNESRELLICILTNILKEIKKTLEG